MKGIQPITRLLLAPVPRTVLAALTVLSAAATLWAAGLSLPYAEFRGENLLPGFTYVGSREVLKERYSVHNKTDSTLDFSVTAYTPSPEQLQKDYEPIPDPSWIIFADDYFTAGPQEKGSTEFYVSIPNDPSLVNRKFQVQLVAQTVGTTGGGFLRLGLGGRAFLHVRAADAAEVREKKNHDYAVRFLMEPHFAYAEDVPLGKNISLKELLGRSLFVRNNSDAPVKVFLKSIALKEAYVQPPMHYEAAPDAAVLSVSRKLTVPAQGTAEIKGKFFLQDKPEFKDKKYYLVIELKNGDKAAPVTKYGRLFIHTRP